MGLTVTPVGEYHVLVQIELTGKTLYFADKSMSMSDGNYYDGRLRISSLQRAFSSFTEPKQRQSTLTATIMDEDGTVRQLLEDYTWGNRAVKVYVGKGTNLNDYDLDFHGIIKFPGGVSYDRKEVRIKLRDYRNKEWVMMPVNRYWLTNYPNLESGADGTPIPVIYGDFSDTPVPVTCIDTSTKQFKIANHEIGEIGQVYKNGSPISSSDTDLINATFKISDSYTPGADEITVKCKGRVVESTLLENPVDILEDVLLNYVGIDAGSIDDDNFDDLRAELEFFSCRRYIDEELSSNTLLDELAIECMFDYFIQNDKYTVRGRLPTFTVDRTFDETQVINNSMRVDSDPESLYANRINFEYDRDPVEEEYTRTGQEDKTEAQTEIGLIIPRTIRFNWLYLVSNTTTIAQHLLLLYSTEVKVVSFSALGEGLLTKLADRVGLTYGNFTNRPLYVREYMKHFNSIKCTINGYDMIGQFLPGYWCNDSAPNYDNADEQERASQGFWTDDDGYAKTGDEDSKVSHWW